MCIQISLIFQRVSFLSKIKSCINCDPIPVHNYNYKDSVCMIRNKKSYIFPVQIFLFNVHSDFSDFPASLLLVKETELYQLWSNSCSQLQLQRQCLYDKEQEKLYFPSSDFFVQCAFRFLWISSEVSFLSKIKSCIKRDPIPVQYLLRQCLYDKGEERPLFWWPSWRKSTHRRGRTRRRWRRRTWTLPSWARSHHLVTSRSRSCSGSLQP